MDKISYKKKVLESAKERQQEIIDDFRSKISEMKSGEMNVNEDQYDHGQKSLDENTNEIISRLADELNFVLDEMNSLNQLNVEDELRSTVTLGAVVKTDNGTFFPSVSIEKFKVNGDDFFGLSSEAPLFKEMRGKKKGDSFSYKGNEYTIVDVF